MITSSKRIENGLLWSSIFSISTLPLGFCSYKFLLPKLNFDDNSKRILNEEIMKMLFTTSALIGFLYGFNTKRTLLSYL